MICYKDQCWCTHYISCATPCERALTDKVIEDAKRWWGSDEAPIQTWGRKPKCFEPKLDRDECT